MSDFDHNKSNMCEIYNLVVLFGDNVKDKAADMSLKEPERDIDMAENVNLRNKDKEERFGKTEKSNVDKKMQVFDFFFFLKKRL